MVGSKEDCTAQDLKVNKEKRINETFQKRSNKFLLLPVISFALVPFQYVF
jgi:hypothetical protein